MSSPVLRLARQSGIYTLGNLAIKAAGLVLLLLYLDPDHLAQAEYGRLVLLETAASLAVVVLGLGLAQGLLKYATDPDFAEDRDALAVTALAATAVLAAAGGGLLVLGARPLAALLVDDPERTELIYLLGLYIGLKVVGSVPYMTLRVEERAGLFVVALLVEFGALLGGVWYFLVVAEAGLRGVLLGFVLSAGLTAALLVGALLVRARWRLRPRLVRRLLAFGAPLTFAGLVAVLLNTGDRFLLDGFRGAEDVAVYGLAQKFGGLVNMVFVQSFNMAFAVLGLKALGADSPEPTNLHRRAFRHYAVLAGWGVLGVSVLALDVTAVISPNPDYLRAEPLILPIALGFMAYGLYYIAVNVLYAAAQTGRIARNVAWAAVGNLVLNLVLIPLLGAMGAALATLGAYAGLAAGTTLQARRTVTVAFPWRALASVVLLVVGLWALAQPSRPWAQSARVAFRLGLVGGYPLLVLAAGIYTREELRLSWVGARAWLRRP
ncbi:MAG: oligosaccharide flippase family protein [Rhodothermales bacterium]|nr:oligosaccharide flippase family protein [Rhodothermales bacterium]